MFNKEYLCMTEGCQKAVEVVCREKGCGENMMCMGHAKNHLH